MADLATDDRSEAFDLGQYLTLLWHWAWLVALAVILAGGMAFAVSKILKPVYQAKTTVMVNELPSTASADYGSIQLNLQLAQTYSQMMTKSPILDEVSKRLGLGNLDPNDITAQSESNIQLINIIVEAPDPKQAALIANTLVAVFREQAQSLRTERFEGIKNGLQSQITETEGLLQSANAQLSSATLQADIDLIQTKINNYQQTYTNLLQNYEQVSLTEAESVSSLVQIEPANPPNKPVRPNMLEYIAIAAMVGFVLAAGMVYLIGITDTTLKTPKEFTRTLDLSVLGIISHYKSPHGEPIIVSKPQSPVSEAFRALRTSIMFTSAETPKPFHSILVISPLAGEGKTTITVNLGMAIAQNGQSVCLIDANLRQPGIHNLLHIPNILGLSQVLASVDPDLSIEKTVQYTKFLNLRVVTSGKIPLNPSEMLGSSKMKEILQDIKTGNSIVLIDTPPALTVTDAAVLLPFVDGVLLVMTAGSIQAELADQLVKNLQRMGANILGIVINDPIHRHIFQRLKLFRKQTHSIHKENIARSLLSSK